MTRKTKIYRGIRKVTMSFLLLLTSIGLYAQDETVAEGTSGFWSDPMNHPLFPLYALTAFIFLVVLVVVVVAFYLIKVLNLLIERAAMERAERLGGPYVPAKTGWQKLMQRLTRSTPVEKEADIMLDHSYDGIRELDNHLPPWWTWLFYATIIWSVGYMIVYHVTDSLPLSIEEYQADVEKVQKLRASQEVVQIDENTLEYTDDAELISKGKEVYMSNCASCHRNDGGGGVGPNLADDYWLHGGSIKNIYATIKNGVPEKGMISWAPILKPEEMRDAAFFIMSLRGTSPAGGKEPQGELYTPEQKPAETKPDSVVTEASL